MIMRNMQIGRANMIITNIDAVLVLTNGDCSSLILPSKYWTIIWSLIFRKPDDNNSGKLVKVIRKIAVVNRVDLNNLNGRPHFQADGSDNIYATVAVRVMSIKCGYDKLSTIIVVN